MSVNILEASTGLAKRTLNVTSTTTWTCPAGVRLIEVFAVGGGGAGGGATSIATNTDRWAAAGGGGGGEVVSEIIQVTPGTTYTITVGAGATYVSSTAGAAGSNSTITVQGNATELITAYGGGGGASVATSTGASAPPAGVGGPTGGAGGIVDNSNTALFVIGGHGGGANGPAVNTIKGVLIVGTPSDTTSSRIVPGAFGAVGNPIAIDSTLSPVTLPAPSRGIYGASSGSQPFGSSAILVTPTFLPAATPISANYFTNKFPFHVDQSRPGAGYGPFGWGGWGGVAARDGIGYGSFVNLTSGSSAFPAFSGSGGDRAASAPAANTGGGGCGISIDLDTATPVRTAAGTSGASGFVKISWLERAY